MKILPINRKRYLTYLRARTSRAALVARGPLQGFTPFSRERKETKSCVIGNGIPKCGTYLMNSILNYLGNWENIGIHINPTNWAELKFGPGNRARACLPQFSAQKLRNGQMVAAHLPWSQGLEKSIAHATNSRRLKHVLIYRDPRDAMVSNMNYVAHPERYEEGRHHTPQETYMADELSNDDDRLTHMIKIHRLANTFPEFAPWLNNPHCHAVRFEELYPELRRLKEDGFGSTLTGLLNYMEIDDTKVDPVDFYDKVYGKSRTASSEEDKVGQFRRVFKSHHHDLLNNLEFKRILDMYGYEW